MRIYFNKFVDYMYKMVYNCINSFQFIENKSYVEFI